MGVHHYSFRQLCRCVQTNLTSDKGKILTLSKYVFPSYRDCVKNAEEVGIPLIIDEKFLDDKYSIDKVILKGLGFSQVDTMDYSVYEGADIAHDLNLPIPDEHKEKYDFVLDAGTIEHVFDLPQVLKNVFDALKIGGIFFFDTPYWYHPHHGYYNCSPELFEDYFQANKWKILRLQPYQCLAKESVEFQLENNNAFPPMYGLLNGIVVKTDMTSRDVIPQQGQCSTTWNRLDGVMVDIGKLINAHHNVYIFGAGETTRLIVNIIDKMKPNYPIKIVSDNPSETGISLIQGIRIQSVNMLKMGDIVLIGSVDHQESIASRLSYLSELGISIVKLF